MLDKNLLNDLFGVEPVKEKESNIFSYRPEILKDKLSAFLSKLKQVGASYTVTHKKTFTHPEYRVKIICEDISLKADLMKELRGDSELEALLILKFAKCNKDFRNHIESHSIWYCHHDAWKDEFYSDSLFLGILSELKDIHDIPSKERIPCDKNFEHWEAEYKALGIFE